MSLLISKSPFPAHLLLRGVQPRIAARPASSCSHFCSSLGVHDHLVESRWAKGTTKVFPHHVGRSVLQANPLRCMRQHWLGQGSLSPNFRISSQPFSLILVIHRCHTAPFENWGSAWRIQILWFPGYFNLDPLKHGHRPGRPFHVVRDLLLFQEHPDLLCGKEFDGLLITG